jgi:class III cytochrome C family protein
LPSFRRPAPGIIVKRALVFSFLAAASIAVVAAQAPKPPETVVLTGSPLGGVKFAHAQHIKAASGKCDTCHHPSKPEKPLKAAQEKCTDCHTKTPVAPMKTKTQAAFHDPMAKKGTCINCHQQQAAKGNTKVPSKCGDCHKKENT